MNEKRCKCVNCGKILKSEDKVYQVCLLETLGGGVEQLFSPTCSNECAEAAREHCLKRWRGMLSGVENQSFQIMTVNQFYGG